MSASDELRRVFRIEATDLIDHIASLIEAFVSQPTKEREARLDKIKRAAHNLKGGAASAGYDAIESFSHFLEDAVAPLREATVPIPTQLFTWVLEGLELCQRVVDGKPDGARLEALLERLKTASSSDSKPSQRLADAHVDADAQPDADADTGTASAHVDADAKTDTGADAGSTDTVTETSQPLADTVDADSALEVRIDTRRLDRLMNFAGELWSAHARTVDHQQRLEKLWRATRRSASLHPEQSALLRPLLKEVRLLALRERKDAIDSGHLTSQLSEAMKEVRMSPLKNAAPAWRRIVRQAAHDCGKSVTLEAAVGNIELDRLVLDHLKSPLMHLLRNAVDHGIESPATRERAGKPARGRIRIDASLRGTLIQLDISDDGRGLNADKIREACVSQNPAARIEIEACTDTELLSLVFSPGFSTAETVTPLSGRGVGLDVVRAEVAALGGNATVVAPKLGGTTFRLEVPVSVLSTRGLFVRSDDITCALPIELVSQTVRVRRLEIETLNGNPAIRHGGVPLQVAWLSDLVAGKPDGREKVPMVVLSRANKRLGLVVGDVLGVREYVTRALPWNLRGAVGVHGIIVQADGSLALSLDANHLFELQLGARSGSVVGDAIRRQIKRVLVVDDSLSSRTLERNMLEAAGFEVILATDGEEAWRLLGTTELDLVVSDIQMPNMDGYELTRRIRAHANLRDLPVILVTSLTRSQARSEAAACGADELVTKGTFEQEDLLKLVAKYL